MRPIFLFAVIALLSTGFVAGAEDDEKKTPEEKLRDEATKLITAEKRESVKGRYQMAPEADDKPYPKVVGVLSDKGAVYQVMILEAAIKDRLKACHNQEVTLMGRVMVKDAGNYFIVDEVFQANAGPKAKKKRGGL